MLGALKNATLVSERTTLPIVTGRSCHGSEYGAGFGAGGPIAGADFVVVVSSAIGVGATAATAVGGVGAVGVVAAVGVSEAVATAGVVDGEGSSAAARSGAATTRITIRDWVVLIIVAPRAAR
jgi:hypothetical protein